MDPHLRRTDAAGRMSASIYLDYQATTPLDPAVLKIMLPYLEGRYGNPHSSSHRFGWEAKAAVEVARGQVATLIGAGDKDILFTGGATEANNLALRGAMEASPRRRLVTLATEHACVLETALDLRARGFELTLLPVQADGLIDLALLERSLGPDVALVSAMMVNNEIGVIQPIADIARLAHHCGALMHCDAAQAAGKVPVDARALGVDLMSLSAHKLYGPKGIGALYVKPGTRLRPQMTGGGQEAGLRSGTLSPALCAGFGKACAIALPALAADQERVTRLWHLFMDKMSASNALFQLNGSATARYFGNLNLSFPGLDGARLLADLRGLALSSGAACASAEGKPSYVLEALGVPESIAQASLRIGFGRMTTPEDVLQAAERIGAAVTLQKARA
jgi:cysteine desulfurase